MTRLAHTVHGKLSFCDDGVVVVAVERLAMDSVSMGASISVTLLSESLLLSKLDECSFLTSVVAVEATAV